MSSQIQKKETILFSEKNKKKEGEQMVSEPLVMMKSQSKQVMIPASNASQELFRIKGSFPFDFYPDELIIEEKRIILKRNIFPFTSQISTIPISKLTSFEITHSIFFSSIFIKWGGVDAETTLQWLKHPEAQKAKEIMDGIRLRDNESLTVMEGDKRAKTRAFQTLGHL